MRSTRNTERFAERLAGLLIVLALVLAMPPSQTRAACRTDTITQVRTLDGGYAISLNRGCLALIVTPLNPKAPKPATGAATIETLTWTNLRKQRLMRQVVTDSAGWQYQTAAKLVP